MVRIYRNYLLPLLAALGTAVPAPAMVPCQCAENECCSGEPRSSCCSNCADEIPAPGATGCLLDCNCPDCDCQFARAMQAQLTLGERRGSEDLLNHYQSDMLAGKTQAGGVAGHRDETVLFAPESLARSVPLRVLLCVWLN